MKTITAEWAAKAEGDLATARRELQAEDTPNYDAACFHAQQCAEKFLKARLVEAQRSVPKVHDLGGLLDLVLDLEPKWGELRTELVSLSNMAVEVRYPGASADLIDAQQAVGTAEKLRAAARAALGMSR